MKTLIHIGINDFKNIGVYDQHDQHGQHGQHGQRDIDIRAALVDHTIELNKRAIKQLDVEKVTPIQLTIDSRAHRNESDLIHLRSIQAVSKKYPDREYLTFDRCYGEPSIEGAYHCEYFVKRIK